MKYKTVETIQGQCNTHITPFLTIKTELSKTAFRAALQHLKQTTWELAPFLTVT